MTRDRISFFFAIALVLWGSTAWAEGDGPVDVDDIMCVHLVDLSEDEFSFLLAWMDGYFNHMHGTAVLSDAGLQSLGAMVQKGCSENPDQHVLDMLTAMIRQDALSQHP